MNPADTREPAPRPAGAQLGQLMLIGAAVALPVVLLSSRGELGYLVRKYSPWAAYGVRWCAWWLRQRRP